MEIGYKLASNAYVQPDVSVTHAGQAAEKYLGGAPAIAIEVVSPSNTAEELDGKTELYFQSGAREVWRVYPKTRNVVVQVSGSAQAVTVRDFVKTQLFPGLEMDVQKILTD